MYTKLYEPLVDFARPARTFSNKEVLLVRPEKSKAFFHRSYKIYLYLTRIRLIKNIKNNI